MTTRGRENLIGQPRIRAATEAGRALLMAEVAKVDPEIADGLLVMQEMFGPGEWIGYTGAGEQEIWDRMVAHRRSVAKAAIAAAKAATA